MKIGVIGGTGLYDLDGLSDVEDLTVETPFGAPTSTIRKGRLDDAEFYFLARHGAFHQFPPGSVNYRANIFALKKLGVTWCVSVSAVGSLSEELAPGHIVVPDQIIDRTKARPSTFFERDICAHVSFADPFCPVLSDVLLAATASLKTEQGLDVRFHQGGTYLCMEGPAFSTRAESQLYRSWGAHIIGMTALPEAKLAREAELSYGTLALVTDYDCWRSRDADVDVEEILAVQAKNTEIAKEVLKTLPARLANTSQSELAADALRYAIISSLDELSASVKSDLAPLIGKYTS